MKMPSLALALIASLVLANAAVAQGGGGGGGAGGAGGGAGGAGSAGAAATGGTNQGGAAGTGSVNQGASTGTGGTNQGANPSGGTTDFNAASPGGAKINANGQPIGADGKVLPSATSGGSSGNPTGATRVNPYTGVPVGQPLQPNDLGAGSTGNQ